MAVDAITPYGNYTTEGLKMARMKRRARKFVSVWLCRPTVLRDPAISANAGGICCVNVPVGPLASQGPEAALGKG